MRRVLFNYENLGRSFAYDCGLFLRYKYVVLRCKGILPRSNISACHLTSSTCDLAT